MFCRAVFCWIAWISGCLIHQIRLMLLLPPLRPTEHSILFSGKSVRLSDDAQSAASSHAPKKGCAVREVWRSQTCTSGSLFFCFLFFGEAKKRKCPVGTRRMVKTTLQADHTAVTLFQAAFGGRGKVCKRRAQRGCTPYGCGCHQLCGEANSKCRRAADAPFLVFRLPWVGVASL